MANIVFENPIIAEQSKAEVPFVPDSYIGHTMSEGKEFLGEKDFVSFETLIKKLHGSKKRVVINIGDSSTSGWDSSVVTENRERVKHNLPVESAFFRYKTYSDILRNQLGSRWEVINAGVPAHTSLQGLRRLRVLLNTFKKHDIRIHVVTVYYGNNDSVWECNREDKGWLTGSTSFLQSDKVITRATSIDYRRNLLDIIQLCRGHKATPILIEPPIPLYWEPATRVAGEKCPRVEGGGTRLVYRHLETAERLWKAGLKESDMDIRLAILQSAAEKDLIVPRIKEQHRLQLRSVADEMEVPLVRIELDRSIDDNRFFIDYCHPNELLNATIADRLINTITSLAAPKRFRVAEILYKFLSPFKPKTRKQLRQGELPTDIYTLH